MESARTRGAAGPTGSASHRVRAAYGANLARLAGVKRRYDPDTLFRVTRNVPPG